MPIIVNIPLHLTDYIDPSCTPQKALDLGTQASEELIKCIEYVTGSSVIFEIVPPAYGLPNEFFKGLLGEAIHLLGPDFIHQVSMRCVDTKKSHKGQYGLDRYKQTLANETQTHSIRAIADKEIHQGRVSESAPVRVQGSQEDNPRLT